MRKIEILFNILAFSLLCSSPLSAEEVRDTLQLKPRLDTAVNVVALPDSIRLNALSPDSLSLGLDTLSIEYQVGTLTDEFLDTLDINKKLMINDYSMVGIAYGGAFNMMNFNPIRKNSAFFTPHQIGITYTKYCKMFNYMPYFGVQVGLFYGQDGYKFKPDSEGLIYDVDGATSAVYEYLEVPALAHLHVDIWRIKLMVNLGLYGGYRLGVHRSGEWVPEEYLNQFYDYENRFDYGFKGGLGIGFIFAPCELHFNATFRHSLSSIYEPDYASPYYYRLAYPMNLAVTVGLHFHLSRRTGKTKSQLKKEAYDIVFNPSPEVKK